MKFECPKCGCEGLEADKDGVFQCPDCKRIFRAVRKHQLFSEKNLKLHGKNHRN
jgi:ribosomal protein L37AE/L43A